MALVMLDQSHNLLIAFWCLAVDCFTKLCKLLDILSWYLDGEGGVFD